MAKNQLGTLMGRAFSRGRHRTAGLEWGGKYHICQRILVKQMEFYTRNLFHREDFPLFLMKY